VLSAIDYTDSGVIFGSQVNKESDVMVIDSAKGDTFDAYYKPGESSTSSATQVGQGQSMLKPLFDGSASWFT
jgi:dethiobiotin synthetase/adenosylmethionine--8-amino-7-oxononanoate aminotransferase